MAKEPQPKRNVYVGGLEEQVNEEILHAAFVPFGDIVEVRREGGKGRPQQQSSCCLFVDWDEGLETLDRAAARPAIQCYVFSVVAPQQENNRHFVEIQQ